MNICGSLMDIFDEKNKDIYVETMLHAPAQPRKRSFMKNQNKIYGSLMDIFDYPKREAQIKQAIKMHILSEKG